MKELKLVVLALVMSLGVAACGKDDKSSATASADADVKMIQLVTTQDGAPFTIDKALFKTPAEKEFISTGKNPYVGNAEAIAAGKKVFQLYSCTQCHGPEAGGQVGPGLVGPDFRYPKDATNKGMFETVWHGTNGGMGAKGIGLMVPGDNATGITPDELLQVIAWIRSKGTITGNE